MSSRALIWASGPSRVGEGAGEMGGTMVALGADGVFRAVGWGMTGSAGRAMRPAQREFINRTTRRGSVLMRTLDSPGVTLYGFRSASAARLRHDRAVRARPRLADPALERAGYTAAGRRGRGGLVSALAVEPVMAGRPWQVSRREADDASFLLPSKDQLPLLRTGPALTSECGKRSHLEPGKADASRGGPLTPRGGATQFVSMEASLIASTIRRTSSRTFSPPSAALRLRSL
jgi:hypothetical protein